MAFPKTVKIVEVGPRDGLQNEKKMLSVDTKVDFINQLIKTGLKCIEAGSFVSPKWVPQMADSAEVFKRIDKPAGVQFPVLVPNLKGLDMALEVGVTDIAIFTAGSETFTKKNLNSTIEESLENYQLVIENAKKHQVNIRGYVSTVLGCPYEGEIKAQAVLRVAKALYDMGCYEISLGDTIGVGTPLKAKALIEFIAKDIPIERLAVHFHNTYGQALANIYACLECGISVIDASVGGLGGCPYAVGASGNVASEEVVYMLEGMGIDTGLSLKKLSDVAHSITTKLSRDYSFTALFNQ